MRTIALTIMTLFFFSCSLEKKADRGDLNAIYAVIGKNKNWNHRPPNKEQKEKIILYCLKGIKLDTGFYYGAFFYFNLAENDIAETAKYSYYKKAAELDDGRSQWITGLNFLEGRTVMENKDSALYWITKASIGNDLNYAAIATKQIGDFYRAGEIVKKDTLISLYYYKKACACSGQYYGLSACDSVIAYYSRLKNLSDTSEAAIYKELGRQKRKSITWK